MYYSITFESLVTGEKRNTWEDWHLIPSAPPTVNNPDVYKNYVDIPGRMAGPLDLSEVLTGGPAFLQAEGSWDLIWNEDYCPFMTRDEAYKALTQFLHGKLFRITLDDDLDTSYIGRIEVKDPKPGNAYSTITLNYTINPTADNPLDVDDSHYTSSTGEIPWYSGGIEGGSSSGGSSSGGSGGQSTESSFYNKGWNAAIDAAYSWTVYTGSGTRSYTFQSGENAGKTRTILEGNITGYTRYSPPSKKSDTSLWYNQGWNAAVDAFYSKGASYYQGIYDGTYSNELGHPYLIVTGSGTFYDRPNKK